jgi:hypothetical protein
VEEPTFCSIDSLYSFFVSISLTFGPDFYFFLPSANLGLACSFYFFFVKALACSFFLKA